MHEITIISGKGGTGKTSVTAAFARLVGSSVICDLDVDASDLPLLLSPQIDETMEFRAGKVAVLDKEACPECGVCLRYCRFGAIMDGEDGIILDTTRCEGCGVCAYFCRPGAISMADRLSGHWFRSRTQAGPMLHAALLPGEENSGKLIALLRREAAALAERDGFKLILSDGPPGIGCPVISSISGTGYVVIVTEPTPSGVHDLKRAADLCDHFRRPVGIILNKADLDRDHAAKVEALCRERGYPVLASIPFEPAVMQALVRGRTLLDVSEAGVAAAITDAWNTLLPYAERARRTDVP